MELIRKLAGKEMFHAETAFFADVTSEKHRLSLLVAHYTDGWLCAVIYPDNNESIMLADLQEPDDAKRYLEDWARLVHRVSGPIEWLPGAPLNDACDREFLNRD